MKLAEITVDTDGGPWADHNMPCTVCRERPAVLDLNTGIMQPCWSCQEQGFAVRFRRRWLWRKPRYGDFTEAVPEGEHDA